MAIAFFCLTSFAHAAGDAGESPAEAKDPAFDVLEFVVEGNTVLPQLAVEKAVYGSLGAGKSVKDVEQARERLERAYHDAGYLSVAVDIPEQKADTGIIVLRVTEGKVERLKVSGSRYHTLESIRAGVPALAAGEVPYFPKAQEQLAKLSGSADLKVTPVLRPGSAPGGLEVDLKVEDRLPLHGSVEVNNRRSAGTETLRLSASMRYENLWQRNHSASLTAQTSPQDTAQVFALSGSYSLPLPGTSWIVAVYGVRSRSNVATVGSVNVIGNGNIVGLRAIRPLPPSGSYFHSVTLGADYKHFNESVGLAGADKVSTPISYVPFTIGYNATLQDASGATQLGTTFNFGVRGVGDSTIDCFGQTVSEFACKRFNARSNYSYLRAELSRSQTLPKSYTLFGKVEGQYAGQPLISNEQFGAGGAESVRGYYESERLGDDGVRAAMELRTPSLLSAAARESWGEVTALAFVEGAKLRVQDPLPSQRASFSLLAAGVGLRMKIRRHLAGAVDIAWPLTDGAQTSAGRARGGFRLAYEL